MASDALPSGTAWEHHTSHVLERRVGARSSHSESLEVPHGGGLVTWWFEVTSYDVGFRAEFAGAEGEALVAWPFGRFKAGARHKGTFVAHAAGAVTFHWSNAYSRFRGKTVRFASHVARDTLVPGGAVVVRLSGEGDAEGEEDPHGVLVPPLDPTAAPGDSVRVVLSDASIVTVSRAALRPAAADFFEQGNAKLVAGGALFFPGRFRRAVQYYESEADFHPHMCHAAGVLAWLRAMLACEPEAVEEATAALNRSRALLETYYRADGLLYDLGRAVTFSEAPPVPLDSVEMAMMTAETHLLQALVMLVQESVVLILKAGMTIRTGWQMFQRLDTTVADADAAAPDGSCQGVSSHARAGLSFGVGTFNLVISALPPALVRIVSSLGFPSSRRVGIERLRHCFGHRGIRAPLAGMGLLSHHVFIPSFSSVDNRRHCAAANAIIDELFRRYPESGVLRIINGRVLRHQRKLGPAVDSFRAGLDPTPDWIELRHLADYELGASLGMRGHWREAASHFERLANCNRWAPAFCTYATAAAFHEDGDMERAAELMATVRSLGIKKLGGSHPLPAEEFAAYRAARYLDEPGNVVLPGVELLHFFGCFHQADAAEAEAMLEQVAKAKEGVEARDVPLQALCHLLHGALLAPQGRYEDADASLSEAMRLYKENEAEVTSARYIAILPYAAYERAQLRLRQCVPGGARECEIEGIVGTDLSPADEEEGVFEIAEGVDAETVQVHLAEATSFLRDARAVKAGYSFKLRLHVRVRLASRDLARIQTLVAAGGGGGGEGSREASPAEDQSEEADDHLISPVRGIVTRLTQADGFFGQRLASEASGGSGTSTPSSV